MISVKYNYKSKLQVTTQVNGYDLKWQKSILGFTYTAQLAADNGLDNSRPSLIHSLFIEPEEWRSNTCICHKQSNGLQTVIDFRN